MTTSLCDGMMNRLITTMSLVLCAASPLLAEEEQIAVPSGQHITFLEVIHNATGPEGLTYRFRFLAPDLRRAASAQGADGGQSPAEGTVDSDAALNDMAFLCDTYALARIPETGPQPRQIIISLSDRPVAFGATDPEATQFFEAYRPEEGVCVWEGF